MNTKIIIGTDNTGKPYSYDIKYMPHLLMAGNTGSGKTQFIHNLIWQLIENNSPEEIKFIMHDCNRVELIQYSNLPYSYVPTLTEMEIGPRFLEWLDYEQNRRYEEFLKSRTRGIEGYNEKFGDKVMPRIIVIINELANLMNDFPAEVEKWIIRVAQLSRYSGIHMVIATQGASSDVITGLIKANIPSRIAFRTNTAEDSKLVIDQNGAEKLNGKGDMLFVPPDDIKPIRLQGTYISDSEISERLKKYENVEPKYNEILQYAVRKTQETINYELLEQAKSVILKAGRATAPLLQRALSIGYSKAARILDKLEEDKFVSPLDPAEHSRKIL